MPLPNLLIIGSQKAGTTSLYNVFRRHPEIFMSSTKETNFFFNDKEYKKGLKFYSSYYKEVKNEKIIGEASPGYISRHICHSRIQSDLPNVKLICTLRDPVKRAYSQFLDNKRQLSETQVFETIAKQFLEKPNSIKLGYFKRGYYTEHISHLFKYFNKENVLFINFEELIHDPFKVYQECFHFLGVDTSFQCPEMKQKFNPFSIRQNFVYQLMWNNPQITQFIPPKLRYIFDNGKVTETTKPKLDEELALQLSEYFKKQNQGLENLIDKSITNWIGYK